MNCGCIGSQLCREKEEFDMTTRILTWVSSAWWHFSRQSRAFRGLVSGSLVCFCSAFDTPVENPGGAYWTDACLCLLQGKRI